MCRTFFRDQETQKGREETNPCRWHTDLAATVSHETGSECSGFAAEWHHRCCPQTQDVTKTHPLYTQSQQNKARGDRDGLCLRGKDRQDCFLFRAEVLLFYLRAQRGTQTHKHTPTKRERDHPPQLHTKYSLPGGETIPGNAAARMKKKKRERKTQQSGKEGRTREQTTGEAASSFPVSSMP